MPLKNRHPGPPRGAVLSAALVPIIGSLVCGADGTGSLDASGPAASGIVPAGSVRCWQEPILIPTYRVGPSDPNPIFYTRESYQGAQKRVYPYALQDRLTHTREDQSYIALNLENEYVKLIVLPEIGGRLFAATDKTNGYDFFYRQHVIKPVLIGMLGAWISGGVEWCAFHHHRNTTFMPVDYRLVENGDGSRTIWFGEIERRHRMKWLVGLTLHPGRSYIETTVKLFNRTPQPHSILYWANVAAHVTDNYQILFPPSVQVATHHSKIDFTHWPIAQGRYLGHDYTGVDLSRWKNMPNPNSFFAWDLQDDFMGGYDHGRRAGVVHVANHHLVCGAKLWEWGKGEAARLWDSLLTDSDGPYVELMVGAWSDNQPDYSWIKPYETKVIRQYWYPVREIGGFKNANLNGAVNLELKPDNRAFFGFHATSHHGHARALLACAGKALVERIIEISPERPFTEEVQVPVGTAEVDLRAVLFSVDGKELVAYQPVGHDPVRELPPVVKAPPRPADIDNNEELYLTGLRIEQINNPSVNPDDYYNEVLKRDPGDTRCNTVLGVRANKRGLYEQAERHLRKAVERISAAYTRPGNAEACYQLGLALRAQGRHDEAFDTFYRASWDQAFHSAAFHQLAELSCRRGAYAEALEQTDRSLTTNSLNNKARSLRAMILRRLQRLAEAGSLLDKVLADDPLDFLALNERYRALCEMKDEATALAALAGLDELMRGEVQSYLELAADYMSCGQWDEAVLVLRRPIEARTPFAATYSLVHYYLGYLYQQQSDTGRARESYEAASRMPSDYCFPFRLETAEVLQAAIRANPSDAKAHYYLGNLLFEIQPDKAVDCWGRSAALDDQFAMVHRNLGWAAYRAGNDIAGAIGCYEKAVARNPNDPRLFYELDCLYELGNIDPRRRLDLLEAHHEVVRSYQESLLREIMVLVLAGRHDEAIEHLSKNRFHAREGTGHIYETYVDAHLLRGLGRMKDGNAAGALDDFRRAAESPENLATPRNNLRAGEIAFHTATALKSLGDAGNAKEFFAKGAAHQGSALIPQTRYCQALCLAELGRNDEAGKVFDDLIKTGKAKLVPREDEPDFFAKFGEQETANARAASARLSIGLGLLGGGQTQEAKAQFEQAAKLNAGSVWAGYYASQVR